MSPASTSSTTTRCKAAQAEGENFAAHPVCAGPFKFVERIAQDRIVLERFADYWNKDSIKFDRISYLPIPDSTVRLANVQSGGLDLIERVAATDVEGVRKDPGLKLTAITGLGYSAIVINIANGERSKTPLGQDVRVRQALQLSIDRSALNQVVFNGEFQPGNQWEPPGNPYYVKELPIPPRDVTQARQLLAEAKQPNPAVELMIPNTPELLQAGQVIQAMAQETGFRVTIKATESASLIQAATKGDYQVEDPAERLAHYRRVAEQILRDLPLIYLWHNKWLWAATPRLAGFTPYPDGLIRPQGMRLE